MHADQLGGNRQEGAHNSVLDQSPLSRPSDRTDKDEDEGAPDGLACQPSCNRASSGGAGRIQCAGRIDVMTRSPLLDIAEPARALWTFV